MPPLSFTHWKNALAVAGISEKSVPGCFVAIPPSLIGVPVAFLPLPRPHFDAAAAGSLGALPELCDDAPGLELAGLLSLPPQAATRNARATAAAAITGAKPILRIAPPPSCGFTGASRRARRAPAAACPRPAARASPLPPPRSRRGPADMRPRAAG